mmetsp:Transcript_43130/g.97471  ORF Transcript_43130/g.97471 Transcript_43130/m.97471 type:complete len:239 (+) Transcript_43130:356-1072(+)
MVARMHRADWRRGHLGVHPWRIARPPSEHRGLPAGRSDGGHAAPAVAPDLLGPPYKPQVRVAGSQRRPGQQNRGDRRWVRRGRPPASCRRRPPIRFPRPAAQHPPSGSAGKPQSAAEQRRGPCPPGRQGLLLLGRPAPVFCALQFAALGRLLGLYFGLAQRADGVCWRGPVGRVDGRGRVAAGRAGCDGGPPHSRRGAGELFRGPSQEGRGAGAQSGGPHHGRRGRGQRVGSQGLGSP